ncbi:MAG TPA: protein kinase [Steroidobacteraceae bacterium]|jgi:hypothetical protein|nr:protein kinase [Steroidobacteraceae bacterium]
MDYSNEADDLFHSITSRIAQRGKGAADEGITVDLTPAPDPAAEPVPAITADTSAADAQLNIGEILRGRYVIESQLAGGVMGTIYQALDQSRSEHTQANAHVALKTLHQNLRARPDMLAKLRREFFCAQALSHRNIVKVYELDLHQLPFFTMELIEGENLRGLMQAFHPLPLPRAYVFAVIREIAEGLAHAHDRQVPHGDVKPQNVMVTGAGELRILDFGSAGESSAALSSAYASCELLEGLEPEPSDDLFALACLAYELIAGEHPFALRRANEARALKISPRRPPGLSGRQWSALSQALAWRREDRPPSVRAWIAELNPGRAPLGQIPQPSNSTASLFAKSAFAPALLALLSALIVGSVIWAVLSRPKPQIVAAEAPAAESADAAPPAAMPEPGLDDAGPDGDAPPKTAQAGPKDQSVRSTPAHPIDKTERIGVASASYAYGPRDKFAEIRVHRSSGSKGTTSFQWWTEPATAIAGTDFAPQAPTTVFFPPRMHEISLFIKLLPNAERKRTARFNIVLGNTSSGSKLGAVFKSSIALLPR